MDFQVLKSKALKDEEFKKEWDGPILVFLFLILAKYYFN